MIYKLILTTSLLLGTAYGSVDKTLPAESKALVNEQIDFPVWKPSIVKKGSGESCDDGNCITRSNCFTKDGKAYKLFSSVRDKVKRKCKKLF